MASDTGFEAIGVEPSEKSSEYAIKTHGVNIINKPIEKVELKAMEYDAITMFNLIEHLLYPKAVLDKLFSALRPGGVLLGVTCNAMPDLAFRRIYLTKVISMLNPAIFVPPYHLHYFTPKSLKKLLHLVGFQKVIIKNALPILNPDLIKTSFKVLSYVISELLYLISAIPFNYSIIFIGFKGK